MNTDKYNDIISKIATEFCLDFILIKAIIMVESSFKEKAYRFEPNFYTMYIKNKSRFLNHLYYKNPEIISASYGLMQIMYLTAEEETGVKNEDPENLYNPENNIRIGSKHLRNKINLYGLERGILSYNSGSPKTSDPKLEKNYSYLKKVAKYYKKFNGENQFILNHS